MQTAPRMTCASAGPATKASARATQHAFSLIVSLLSPSAAAPSSGIQHEFNRTPFLRLGIFSSGDIVHRKTTAGGSPREPPVECVFEMVAAARARAARTDIRLDTTLRAGLVVGLK